MKKLARHAKKSKGKSNSTKDAVEAAADDGGEIGDASEVAKPPLKRVRAKSASSTPARAPKPSKKAPASKKKNSGKDTDKAEGDDSPAHEGHDDDDAGPATFARRYRPTLPFYQQKWLALRDSYATYIRPFVKNHSKLEDPVGF